MKYRIFIVEDDETIANLLKKHLSSWGYKVFLAEDFSNVLQEFAGKDPQLVLLDLKLPFITASTGVRKPKSFPGAGDLYLLRSRQYEHGHGHEPWSR